MELLLPSTLAPRWAQSTRQAREEKPSGHSAPADSPPYLEADDKLLSSLNFLLELRMTVLPPPEPSHRPPAGAMTDQALMQALSSLLQGLCQGQQCHRSEEGPEHGTFVGGCVCWGSGGCSVVPIGSSNRGLVTQQPEEMRTREEEMKEELG